MMRSIQFTHYDSREDLQEALLRNFQEGVWLMSGLMVFTIFLELLSWETARALYRKNPRLYQKAWIWNVVNHFGLAIPPYALLQLWCTQPLPVDDSPLSKLLTVVWQVMQITCLHSILFYQVHKTFHSHPSLYKWHKFHHLFNTHVPPVSATAVSPVEYLVAYLSPFLVSLVVLPSSISPDALWGGVVVLGCFNVMMHAPPLEQYYDPFLPAWMVGTGDHLEHHSRLNCHYAAPTVDVDYLLQQVQSSALGKVLFRKEDEDKVDTTS